MAEQEQEQEQEKEEVQAWLSSFEAALLRRDVEAAADMFLAEECFWRDLVAFTWNIYTAESQQEIRDMLHATIDHTILLTNIQQHDDPDATSSSISSSSSWKQEGEVEEQELGEGMVMKQSFFTFETRAARGRGHVKLRGGKCWCLLTAMQELKGHEEPAGERRDLTAPYPYWQQHKKLMQMWNGGNEEEEEHGGGLYCLVVGGGHAGISLAARLRRLRVPAIVVDKNARPGDSWRNRYDSLRLHLGVWYNHMPYLPFPDHWPVYSSKDQIADWLEAYTRIMELVYWGSAECKSARFDAAAGRWEVAVDRGAGRGTVLLRPAHLVLATGLAGIPNVPADSIPGAADKFTGVQCHSSEFRGAGSSAWAGKRCVVVGSSNSAHDICADLRAHGAARVTMLQRSSTHVVRSATMLATDPLPFRERCKYSTRDADLLLASVPYKIMHRPGIELTKHVAELDSEFYRGLHAVGFMHDFGDDGSGMVMKYLRRASGFSIDMGASEMLIRGEIALRSGVSVTEMKEQSVVLSDGSELDADLVVYATGYRPMNEQVAKLISQDVADKVGKCWGLGSNTTRDPGPWERELRNMWKPTHQEGLWLVGNSFQECRHYSLYLALQLKARMEGIPVHVYGMGKVHHLN